MYWFVFLLALTPVAVNLLRLKKNFSPELIPNCLLTRYPIVFIDGHKSIFYFLNYWNHLPTRLRDHGYDVEQIHLPWRNSRARLFELQKKIQALKLQGEKIHILIDESIFTELNGLNDTLISLSKSMTILRSPGGKYSTIEVKDLRPSPFPCFDLFVVKSESENKSGFLRALFWWLHKVTLYPKPVPALETLNFNQPENSQNNFPVVLNHLVKLAESDFQNG